MADIPLPPGAVPEELFAKMWFTPSDARTWVARGALPKRTIGALKKKLLLLKMKNGTYDARVNNTIFVWIPDGSLLNGNHRMAALAEMPDGYRTYFPVLFTYDQYIVNKIDTGANRTPSHTAQINGVPVPDSPHLSSLVKTLFFMAGHHSGQKIDNDLYQIAIDKWRPQLMELMPLWRQKSAIPSRFKTALYFIVKNFMSDEELAKKIFQALEGDEKIYEGDPMWRTFRFFADNDVPTRTDGPICSLLIDALNETRARKVYKTGKGKNSLYDFIEGKKFRNYKPMIEGFDEKFLIGS